MSKIKFKSKPKFTAAVTFRKNKAEQESGDLNPTAEFSSYATDLFAHMASSSPTNASAVGSLAIWLVLQSALTCPIETTTVEKFNPSSLSPVTS